jgi:type I restriction enzyme S subunit
MEHIEADSMRLLGTAKAGEMKSSAVHFWPGDVLYGRLRPYLNKVYRPAFEGLCSAEFIVLPAEAGLDSRFVQYRLNSGDFVAFASHLNAGDRPRVDFEQIAEFPVRVPPPREQKRIADRVEEHLTRLAVAADLLVGTRSKIRSYRASVLKAACEGRLVPTEAELARAEGRDYEPADQLLARILTERRARWEADQLAKLSAKGKPPKDDAWKKKYADPDPPGTADLSELPEGWVWATVEQVLVGRSCNGLSVKGSDSPPGVPALKLGAMKEDGLDYSEVRFLRIHWRDVEELEVRRGDFFVTRGNGSLHLVGRGVVAGDPPIRVIFPDTMIRLRPHASIMTSGWLPAVWRARLIRRQIEAAAKTTAGIWKISQGDIGRMMVAIPPLAEQHRIVAEVERRLSIADEAEATIEAALTRAERLRQAILKRAFEGKLVPQDPNDEPAGVLLERIHKQREAESPAPARKGRAPRVWRPRKASRA